MGVTRCFSCSRICQAANRSGSTKDFGCRLFFFDELLDELLPLCLLELLFDEEVLLVLFTDLEPVLWSDPSKLLERLFFADPDVRLLDSPLERLLPLASLEMLYAEELLLVLFTDLEPVLWFDISMPSFSFLE
jgi:hypothetical protein